MFDEIYEAVFTCLGFFCHQLPQRSFFIFGVQFPLCIRCSAMLMGACGAVAYLLLRLRLPSVRFCLVMILPSAVEIAWIGSGLGESTNWIRGTNGLLAGFFVLTGSMVWLAGRQRGATSSPELEAS
jgi:uncharacterized membrane protein